MALLVGCRVLHCAWPETYLTPGIGNNNNNQRLMIQVKLQARSVSMKTCNLPYQIIRYGISKSLAVRVFATDSIKEQQIASEKSVHYLG
jgi:hypothetical protein